jgi:hypothetical protein
MSNEWMMWLGGFLVGFSLRGIIHVIGALRNHKHE